MNNRSIRRSSNPCARMAALRQDGATLVEFAIISPLAVLLVLAIIQIGLIFSAKSVVNEAAFMAARAGAISHAQSDAGSLMWQTLVKALLPFYQDTSNADPYTRVSAALLNAEVDTVCIPMVSCPLSILVQSPSSQAFDDFGFVTSDSNGHKAIPNDNLSFRSTSVQPNSQSSIQDANLLKIKVTYGYDLKVPLMKSVIYSVMCAFDTGVEGFGRGDATLPTKGTDCLYYYSRGRVPIVAYATVQMQTTAWQ